MTLGAFLACTKMLTILQGNLFSRRRNFFSRRRKSFFAHVLNMGMKEEKNLLARVSSTKAKTVSNHRNLRYEGGKSTTLAIL
jgi:hypothetical protein